MTILNQLNALSLCVIFVIFFEFFKSLSIIRQSSKWKGLTLFVKSLDTIYKKCHTLFLNSRKGWQKV